MSRKLKGVCYAPGDRCLGCAHYRGEVDTCEYSDTGEQAMADESDAGVEGLLPPPPGPKDGWFDWWQGRYGKAWADKQQEALTTAQRTIEELLEHVRVAANELDQTRRERDEARAANESAKVCAKHTSEFVGNGCLVCERDEARESVEELNVEVNKHIEAYNEIAARNNSLHTQVADLTRERDEAEQLLESLQNRYEQVTGEVADLTERLERVVKLLRRYRNETPLGHQPHMIAS